MRNCAWAISFCHVWIACHGRAVTEMLSYLGDRYFLNSWPMNFSPTCIIKPLCFNTWIHQTSCMHYVGGWDERMWSVETCWNVYYHSEYCVTSSQNRFAVWWVSESWCICAVAKGILVTMAINPSHAVWIAMETETKTQGVPACSYE